MTLVALFAMTAGAWAQMVTWVDTDLSGTGANAVTKDGVTLTPSNNNAKRNDNYFYAEGTNTFTTTLGNFTKIEIVFQTNSDQLPISIEGWTYEEISKFQPDHQAYPYYWIYTGKLTWEGNAESVSIQGNVNDIQSITFTIEPPIEVTWDATTKTAAFTMPGYNVVLTPIYAKAAAFATTGTEPDVTTLLPAAAEGVIAGTDAPLIAEGTGIVAFAGTSTEVTQGTVMYAVTDATVTDAPALTAFSATVPKASDIPNADDGAEVKVWYYIQGADAPQGEAATLDNTFENSEVCATPLTVTVLSNKFDLTLKAANANTIDATQASKGTVSVKEGTGAAVDKTSAITDEGKLKAVKMGSEVKLNAKQGYKFRKVEVKKAGPGPLTYATKEGAVTRIKFNRSGDDYYADFTYSNGSFTRTGGTQGYGFSGSWTMKEENGVLTMTANYNEMNTQWIYFVCTFYVDTNEYTVSNTGSWNISFKGIEVNGTDVTDQLTKVK